MRRWVAGAAVMLALAGCGEALGSSGAREPTPVDTAAALCSTAVQSIVVAAQRYVAGFEPVPVAGTTPQAAAPAEAAPSSSAEGDPVTEVEFQAVLSDAQAVLGAQACDPAEVRTELEAGLGHVEARGAVAKSLLDRLTANLTGDVDAEPRTRTLAEGETLSAALARLADGATLELPPGEFRLEETLVLLAGVTLRGAGRDATTIVTSAPEAGVLVITDGRVELADLSIRREGAEPGSAVLAGPAASLVLTGVRVSGAVADEQGLGGAGVLMSGGTDAVTDRGTTLEVTDSEFVANGAAGLLVAGAHRISVLGGRFADNGQCGICFLDSASGSVEDGLFENNAVGLAVVGSAAPNVLRGEARGGQVGIQVADAAPLIQDFVVTGASSAAFIFGGTAGGALDGARCVDVPYGIVVGPDVTPTLGQNACEIVATDG